MDRRTQAPVAARCDGRPARARALNARELRAGAAAIGTTVLLALAAKSYYADAGPSDLRFVLAPTAALAGLLTGASFHWEVAVGYESRDAGVAITPGCAGGNFFVVALCALVVGFVGRFDGAARRLAWPLLASGLAFAATVAANAVRIAFVTWRVRTLGFGPLGLPPEVAHRLEGVATYLPALLALLMATDRAVSDAPHRPERWIALAGGGYLTVTLALPWLRGTTTPGFGEHALVVGTGAAGVGLVALVAASASRRARTPRRSCQAPASPAAVRPAVRSAAAARPSSGSRAARRRPARRS